MNELEDAYFEWLLRRLDPRGVPEGVVYVCSLLHNCNFLRRVGRDYNRAVNGAALRKDFILDYGENDIDPHEMEDLLMQECTWLEMLVRLCEDLDYQFDGSVLGRFYELTGNMGLDSITLLDIPKTRRLEQFDQGLVNRITSDIDNNRFDRNGRGGLFPRHATSTDQRTVEIWDQMNGYFNERLEGILWTS